MKIRLGQTYEGVEVSLDVTKLFKQRLLVQGISGSRKSATIDDVMRQLKLNMSQQTIKDISDDLKLDYKIGETESIPQIILDWEGERIDMYRNFGNYMVLTNNENDGELITLENSGDWGRQVRQNQVSVIIDLSSFKSVEERETIVSEFISAIIDSERKFWKPCIILIDEGHNLCKQSGKCHSRDSIIRLCETGRKRGLATIMVTQRLAQLNKNASAQLANRIIGLTIELPDRESATRILGISSTRGHELAELQSGEFFCFGDALVNEPTKFKVDEKSPEELRGLSTNPLDVVNEITESLKKKQHFEGTIDSMELSKLNVKLKNVSDRLSDAELVGYSEAMHNVRNRIISNKSKAGFWKGTEDLKFEKKMVRGLEILDLV